MVGAESEFIQWLATLGIGGILAAFVFMFYRKDVAAYTDLWKGQSEALLEVVKDNTAAITKLIDVVDDLRRRLDDNNQTRWVSNRKVGDKSPWRLDSEQK